MGNTDDPASPEVALALTRESALVELLASAQSPTLADCIQSFNWQAFPEGFFDTDTSVERIYFGGEFCDRLIPSKKAMQHHNLALSLLTPMVSDKGLRRLTQLMELLPMESEVIVDDWGVLRLLKRDFPGLTPVVGRQLCKMIEDSRLLSEQWARLYPHCV